jgi:hypothetical protein
MASPRRYAFLTQRTPNENGKGSSSRRLVAVAAHSPGLIQRLGAPTTAPTARETCGRFPQQVSEVRRQPARLPGRESRQSLQKIQVNVASGGQAMVAGKVGRGSRIGRGRKECPLNPMRRGWLKNGNPPGDYLKAPRCGAKTRRGTGCQGPAMRNGRCRMHGGLSTGPRTPEGIERIRQSRTKYGIYSQKFKAQRAQGRDVMRQLKALIEALEKGND